VISIDQEENKFVNERGKQCRFFQTFKNGILSVDKNLVYYMGIIDTLTRYTMAKKVEHIAKKLFLGKDISCVPP